MDPQNNQGQQANGANPPQGNPQGGQNPPVPPVPPVSPTPQSQPMPPQGAPQGYYPQDPNMFPPGAYPPGYYPQMPPQGMPQGAYQQPGMPPQGMPQGAYPQPGMPPQGFPPQGMPGAGMPPAEPEDTTPANFQLGTKLPAKLSVTCPASSLNFDEEYFIRLLAGSISLSKDEKKRIIESIPKLKQAQIDELIRIFEEEKQKFAALSKKHVPQLEKLAEQHYLEWMDLETEFFQEGKKQEDTSKADEIRKQLGL